MFNLVELSLLCAAGGWRYAAKMSALNTFFAALVPYINVITKEKFEKRGDHELINMSIFQ